MGKRICGLLLVFVLCIGFFAPIPKVQANEYMTDAMAQKFVDLFYSNSGDTANMVKKVLTGEEFGTVDLLKEIAKKAATFFGYAEQLEMLSYDEQMKLLTISKVVKGANSIIKITDNYKSMWQSTNCMQTTVDGIQIGVDLASVWGFSLPPTVSAACAAVELTLLIGGSVQQGILNEYQAIYQNALMLAKYANTELPSPIGYITVVNEFNYSQEEVDAILSGIYMQFIMDEFLNDLPSGGSSSTPTSYTITYNSNCSYIKSFSETYDLSQDADFPNLERNGYAFAGWYHDSDCTNPVENYSTENQTWYAKWIPYYEYTITNGEITLNKLLKYEVQYGVTITDVEVPSYIDGYPVTVIGGNAFSNIIDLTGVKLPDTITSIGSSAFENCTGLTSIYIPSSVKSIGNYAFNGCSNLTDVNISNGVVSIGSYCFSGCSSLKNITIPNSVTSIGKAAFNNCSNLVNITIPDSITTIESSTFEYCSNLEYVNLPDNLTNIGNYAFRNCASLTSITLPSGIISVGTDAFYNCNSIEKVHISDLATWCHIDFKSQRSNPLGSSAVLYINNVEVTDITIPQKATKIGNYAFSGCSNLTKITIHNGVTNIGNYAFAECKSLTTVILPEGITSISNSLFRGCSNLMSVQIPDGVTKIGDGAFYECSNLKSIEIPEGVTSVGKAAFAACSNLTLVDLPESVTTIGKEAFKYCTKLTSIELPKGIKIIEHSTFRSSGLTRIEIPEGVTTIEDSAFSSCKNLMSVVMPDSVTNIGNHAFQSCSNLVELELPVFLENIGSGAFYNCKNIGEFVIPHTLESIGSQAFYGCSSLEDIYFKDDETTWAKILDADNDLSDITVHYNCKYASDTTKLMQNIEGLHAVITPDEQYVGDVVILALYADETLTDVQTVAYDGNKINLSSDKVFDTVNVMIWNSIKDAIPVRDTERYSIVYID